MYKRKDATLKPRNGSTLIAAIAARISGCANQKELSLDDQIDHAKQVIAEMYDGQIDYRIVATKGKGERLDRPELAKIEAMLRSEELDLLVVEDLGRLVRGTAAKEFCGIAVDHGVRVIAPNDYIDTNDETWEEDVISACRDHVGHNSHTSKRIKHKLMNRFLKFGGATARPIAGYIVPEEAETYADWQRDERATPVIAAGLNLLKKSGNYSEVAEYFNTTQFEGGAGFPTGPYCRRRSWDGSMVARFYRNRTLGGAPGRGFRHTRKVHETGQRVSVPNPDGPHFIECPHLAHVDLAELDAVNALIREAHKGFGRKKVNGRDPLARVARKDSRFPAPVATCAYCGRRCVWGGNGIKAHLMCSGAREYRCWNSIGIDGALLTRRIMEALTRALRALDQFEEQFQGLVRQAVADQGDLAGRRERLHREKASLAARVQNVVDGIAACGPEPSLKDKLNELKAGVARVDLELRKLGESAAHKAELPMSLIGLRGMFESQFLQLAEGSRQFADLLRKLVPRISVFLVRACDGGHPVPRANVTLELDGVIADAHRVPQVSDLLRRELIIDLFEPPQRVTIRERATWMAAAGTEQRVIARELGVTETAVQRALALDLHMGSVGLADPYCVVITPPADYPKLRRHRNARFRFEPLEGHQPFAW